MKPRPQEHFAKRKAAMEALSEADPSDKSAPFFAALYAGYESELSTQQMIRDAASAGELIDLRFIGPQLEGGELPLSHFLDIFKPLDAGINHAAFRLRTGKESKQINSAVRSALDLRIAGTAKGSARILLSGDGRPDLTGVCLFRVTLEQVFRFLNADNDAFYDAVDAVGSTAARHFGQALTKTEKHGLAADFCWYRGSVSPATWEGNSDSIHRLRTLIDSTQEPEVFEEDLEGIVAAIRDTGLIDLRVGQVRVKVRFPLRLIEKVQGLAIKKHAKLRVASSRYWDPLFKIDVIKRTLINVLE